LDNGLTELNSDVYSAIRDVKPSRDNHADSRLLSSNVFSFSEIPEARSVDGRREPVVNAEETVEDELIARSQLPSLPSYGSEILQFTALSYKLP